ncbi:uncharacterized protein LOC127780537 [Oryza glaberrima]|uniref:uncharacterized protein LOC127780537 n=1 Tax=Oryza glaberrima TaxID=4538 RepID=UPI00023E2052|nr:uncharacterized protein LOC127780537 [Oryza glaberrima]
MSHLPYCSDEAMLEDTIKQFTKTRAYPKLVELNGLVVVTTIFAGILVAVGAYRPRYRHHALVRLLFYGATTLSLPIVSYVVSRSWTGSYPRKSPVMFYYGKHRLHSALQLVWICLVQIVQVVGINYGATVAADEREEGRGTGVPMVLFLEAIWVSYLVYSSKSSHYRLAVFYIVAVGAFAVIFARLMFKCYAFKKAQPSYALRRNPRLIVGYMKQLQDGQGEAGTIPPLIVMGEETQQVEKRPDGYYFKRMSNHDTMNCNRLVTIDTVWKWQLEDQLKDLCLSFALHKILRCRFADYTATDTGCVRAHDFLWELLLNSDDHERLLGIILNELSCLHDYYYSSLPISYSNRCLPLLNIVISLFTISYCLLAGLLVICYLRVMMKKRRSGGWGQIYFRVYCVDGANSNYYYEAHTDRVGNLFYDIVPIFLLLTLVVLAEARDIASYICSIWTKVTLLCHSLNNDTTWQRYHRLINAVSRYQCKAVNPLDDKMRQLSILELNFRPRNTITGCLLRLLHPLGMNKNVNVPTAVKAGIINALRSLRCNNEQLSNGVGFLQRRQNQQEDHGSHNNDDDDDFLWACTDANGTTDVILTWHIATSILEMKLQDQQNASSDNQIAATHLSRYCAYLVAYWPELLPDDDKWSKSLYDDVSKDSMRVLAMVVSQGGGGGGRYEEEMKLLTEKSEHDVVKNGVRLGRQLMELEDKEEAWRLLAGVWSEMVLYVAPSENLHAHSDAIARGGELITVVWALLMHLGIYTRPPSGASPANSVRV